VVCGYFGLHRGVKGVQPAPQPAASCDTLRQAQSNMLEPVCWELRDQRFDPRIGGKISGKTSYLMTS